MLSSTSDGIEASELKRPLTPPADTDTDETSSPRKRGRPKKAPTRCTIDIDTNFDDNLETSFGDGWQMSPQNNVFTPHYLDPNPTYNSSQVSNSTLSNGGVDSLANNQVKKTKLGFTKQVHWGPEIWPFEVQKHLWRSWLHDSSRLIIVGLSALGPITYCVGLVKEMGPTLQRPLLKDSWHQIWRLWEEQLVDPPIAYMTSVNVM